MGFSGGLVIKNLPAIAGVSGLIPGLGRSPGEGNGNPLQYFYLDALEHVRSITAAPAETPHEKWFQDNYGDAIENALEKLKTPSNPAKPGSSWIPFKEVQKNLKNATEMGNSVR